VSKDAETAVVVAFAGIAAYLIYQAWKGAGNVAAAAGEGVVNTLENAGVINYGLAKPGQTYNVTMPDGSVQTVPYGQLPSAAGGGIQSNTPISDAFSSGFGELGF
jgi:hypothetical protein